MNVSFPGLGTLVNVAAILVGGLAGLGVGHRLGERTRSVVTDCLGLITLLVAAQACVSVTAAPFMSAVGSGGSVLVVLAALLVGGIGGSLVGIERRLEALAARIQGRTAGAGDPGPAGHAVRERFVEGWLTASLLFCVGPLAVLGALADGLGHGIEQLTLKSVLDGFAALAFASSFGVGVLFSAVSVAVVQGGLTLVGVLLGNVLPDAHVAALTATGGLLLVGVAIRLLGIREIPVGDMLPAVFLAPAITELVVVLRH